MNLIELNHALRQLRLGRIAAVIETRLQQAQVEPMAPIDLISCLVSDELTRRSERETHTLLDEIAEATIDRVRDSLVESQHVRSLEPGGFSLYLGDLKTERPHALR